MNAPAVVEAQPTQTRTTAVNFDPFSCESDKDRMLANAQRDFDQCMWYAGSNPLMQFSVAPACSAQYAGNIAITMGVYAACKAIR